MDVLEREKTKRILDWFDGKKQGPFKIDIELHRRCNLNCLSCSRRADDKFDKINDFSKKIEMPLKKWLEIIDEAAELGVKEWHIAGGGDPPFVHSLLFPVMERIKKHDMYGILTTNGTNLTKDNIKKIVEIGWDRIHFSVDGPNAKTHDFLRQTKGCFKKVTDNMLYLKKLKKKLKKQKPMINMNTVLSIYNYNKLPNMVKLASKLGVEYMFVEPLIVYSDYGEKMKLKKEHLTKFKPYLRKAIRLAKFYRIDSNFLSIDSNLDSELIKKSSKMNDVVKKDSDKFLDGNKPIFSVPCYDPWFHMSIKANGKVTACDVSTDNSMNVKDKSLKDIWYGPYFEKIRNNFVNKKIPEFCKQCNPSHTTQRRWLRRMMDEMENE
jgi:MoaA/NifB/PqqE/SkfB family radical SAM enzyme